MSIQFAGAALLVIAFLVQQITPDIVRTPSYLACNVVGSALMAGTAATLGQWGFVVLEGSWATVAAVSLVRSVPADVVGWLRDQFAFIPRAVLAMRTVG